MEGRPLQCVTPHTLLTLGPDARALPDLRIGQHLTPRPGGTRLPPERCCAPSRRPGQVTWAVNSLRREFTTWGAVVAKGAASPRLGLCGVIGPDLLVAAVPSVLSGPRGRGAQANHRVSRSRFPRFPSSTHVACVRHAPPTQRSSPHPSSPSTTAPRTGPSGWQL